MAVAKPPSTSSEMNITFGANFMLLLVLGKVWFQRSNSIARSKLSDPVRMVFNFLYQFRVLIELGWNRFFDDFGPVLFSLRENSCLP